MAAKPKLGRFEQNSLRAIPRGDTCPGVNRLIIEQLGARFDPANTFKILDLPCGSGTFLATASIFFPNAEFTGCDIAPVGSTVATVLREDLSAIMENDLPREFNVITCISGVMEFENTGRFFQCLRQAIAADGLLYVTNDNIATVKDRLLYLIGGRFSQYRFDPEGTAPTWKVTPLDVLLRTLRNAGFDINKVAYTEPSFADLLWIPLAAPLYLLQRIMGQSQRFRPFRSLLSRHYLLECVPAANQRTAE